MKISITAKLFAAILAACITVLVVQSTAMRVSFQHGFVDYLDGEGVERMEQAMPRVVAAYREHGNWDFLRTDFRAWFRLLVPHPDAGPPPAPTTADETGVIPRIGLLDAAQRRVAGNPNVDTAAIRRPVIVDGRLVGWIGMVSFEQVMSSRETAFLGEQRKALWLIGLASVLVAIALTLVATRALLRRLRAVAQGTHALAAGNYASRIDPGAPDELGTLARDFNHMAQALENNERTRRAFMADISHELRTPLAVIRAEVEAIQDGIRPPTPQSLDAMHQEVGRLGKLIDDLHDLSLTDVGAFAYRRAPIDLGTVLRAAADGMRARFAAASLRLEEEPAAQALIVLGDERRLHQLFANLLENALRYTDAGGVVRVHWTRQADNVVVRVEDSAPGVPADKRKQLFERFYRVEASRNRASGGSGLGLAICRNIAEAHQGAIRADASPLGGLRITIELPLDAA
ncbi:two-component sensor histidine kinase [Cupriavidus sp. TA19]|uniref:sensor histidine kinase efflux regulator BaeS n=1 Tax=unclassified Cupriavidus TaxID=2640874 RepID=UPI000E2F4F10|nr:MULTISPECIES: sensor histidine kinase efflux regulator BaeS [unclassified Cupriavidus]BDB28361.1 sensor histidine kinase efflux regulator BaeS [Cupriavidus sp. P-10]GLC91124.1 two-component sensor histidine kinase [Cupriavidus sp. TA19]